MVVEIPAELDCRLPVSQQAIVHTFGCPVSLQHSGYHGINTPLRTNGSLIGTYSDQKHV
jgi:hypothetical protein